MCLMSEVPLYSIHIPPKEPVGTLYAPTMLPTVGETRSQQRHYRGTSPIRTYSGTMSRTLGRGGVSYERGTPVGASVPGAWYSIRIRGVDPTCVRV